MNPFQNPDVLSIQRYKADILILSRDRIRFVIDNKLSYSAILDPRIYLGNFDILEDSVRNKKKVWLILEVRRTSTSSTSGKIFYLSDAHYLNDTDEVEDINPSKR